MKTKNLLYLISILLVHFSCKKTKLKDELSVLVGEWEWIETRKSEGGSCHETLFTPSSEGYTFTIKFLRKGKLELYKNGKKTEEYRLVIVSKPYFSYYTDIGFRLDNKKANELFIRYCDRDVDTLREIRNFPIKFTGNWGCDNRYENVFVRK